MPSHPQPPSSQPIILRLVVLMSLDNVPIVSADCSLLLRNHRYNNGYFLALAALIVDIVAINKNMTPHWLRRIVTVMITPRTRQQPPATSSRSFKHHSDTPVRIVGVDAGAGLELHWRSSLNHGEGPYTAQFSSVFNRGIIFLWMFRHGHQLICLMKVEWFWCSKMNSPQSLW